MHCPGHLFLIWFWIQENQEIIKCYASAWSKGALDRAKIRNSVSFSLAQFHVASFIFKAEDDQNQLLRKTVAKDLLVALARRPHFQVCCFLHSNFLFFNEGEPSLFVAFSNPIFLMGCGHWFLLLKKCGLTSTMLHVLVRWF